MSNILFANNASTILAAPISSGATSCTVTTGTGALFPNPSGGQYFCMTFVDAATGLLNEIVHVTARSGDTMTIQRAQEGTTALAWLAGDIAANFWTAGSIAALLAGFPVNTGTLSTTQSLSGANAGTMYRISAASITITLPDATTVSGMSVGFSMQASGSSILSSAGGTFQGAAVTGSSSITLAQSEFICVQSNGINWVVFSGSPNLLAGGTLATQSWVTANFDPLGSASAAQTNAQNFASALQGNLKGTNFQSGSYTLQTSDVGGLIGLAPAASSNATFTTIDGTALGQNFFFSNLSTTAGVVLTVRSTTSATFNGMGLTSASSFQIAAGGAAWITWRNASWVVEFWSGAFDPTGAAANAQSNAEAFASALAGNLSGVTTYTASATQPTSDYGALIQMSASATGAVALILPARVAGKQMIYVNRNATFNLVLFGAGSDAFVGLTGSNFGTGVGNFTVPPQTTVYIQGAVSTWVVTANTNTQGNYAGVSGFTASATVPATAFGNLVAMRSTATGPTTLTLPSPAGKPGQSLLLQNISAFTLTITTPVGFFYGLKSTSTFTIPSGGSAEVVSDGINFDVCYASDSFDQAGVLAAQMVVPGGLNSALNFERVSTFAVGTSYAGSTFTGLGYSGTWICLGNCAVSGGFIGLFQRTA
jgi:hypothetical protein